MSLSAFRADTGTVSCASAPCMSPSSRTTLKPCSRLGVGDTGTLNGEETLSEGGVIPGRGDFSETCCAPTDTDSPAAITHSANARARRGLMAMFP